MEEIIKNLLHIAAFIIGLIGVAILLIGLTDAIIIYLKDSRNFQKIRYVIGKHILLGLDFLVVKDILETVFLRSSDVKIMDIILLIVIVGIRVVLTTHTSKGIQEMHEEIMKNQKHSKAVDKEINSIEKEESKLKRQIKKLKKEDKESEEEIKELEIRVDELSKFLNKK